ncbi:MAG TPA: tyrosine-type recombinase/integrase [Methyloceanibacter sp.]|nr:tyrosine-type recombinase/integrase [Methyloceanibacter sp.]
MALKFTDKTLRGLNPPATGQVDYWDELLPGLGIRIGTTGKKSFFVGTRISGHYRRITLKPPYPHLELAEARKQARAIIADAHAGIGPEVRKKRSEAGTFKAVCDAFMTDYAKNHRTKSEMQRKIDVELADWHDRQITEITRADIKEKVRLKAREAGVSANRLLGLIGKIFAWALDEEIIDASPALRIKQPTEEFERDRVLSLDEIKLLWPAFEQTGYPWGPLYQMLLLTAQRRGEVASMKWSQINNDGWRLPAANAKTKTGHLVPLSSLAREILGGIPQISEYVFRAHVDAPLQGWSLAKRRIDKIVTLPEPWHTHDLRRSAATHMRSIGVDRLVVSKVLNHAEGGITKVYDRWSADPEKMAAMERWANRLREIISGAAGDNVVQMRTSS